MDRLAPSDFSCFVINLEKDHEKKIHMKQMAQKNDLNPIFIDGIYGASLNSNYISQHYSEKLAKKNIGRSLTKGEIGCALSHLSIYRKMIEEKIDAALILEDDVFFEFNMAKLSTLIKQLPTNWECILLGHHSKFSRDDVGIASFWGRKRIDDCLDIIRFSDRVAGGYGYLINQSGAKKRLKEYGVICKPTDYWVDKTINLYGITPPVINIAKEYKTDSLLDKERGKEVSESHTQQSKTRLKIIFSKLGFTPLIDFFYYLRSLALKIKPIRTYY